MHSIHNDYQIFDFITLLFLVVAAYLCLTNFISLFDTTGSKSGNFGTNDDSSRVISDTKNTEPTEEYYKTILGIHGSVDSDNIKRMYRIRVSEYHPDKVMHLGPKLKSVAEEEIRKINEAYEYFSLKYNI
jgi:hypothetical protein